jgi:hypothetical protein
MPIVGLLSIANPEQVLPLAEVTPEAKALLKRRDDASLDLLSALSGSLAN